MNKYLSKIDSLLDTHALFKKSQTCEEGVAQLRNSYWNLLMNLKNKLLKKPWEWAGPFRRFSIHMWQNARANTVRREIVCNVYFPFSKIL